MEKLTPKSTIAQALANPKAVALCEKRKPGITKNPAIRMFQRLRLEQLIQMDQLGLTAEKLEAMLKEINAEE